MKQRKYFIYVSAPVKKVANEFLQGVLLIYCCPSSKLLAYLPGTLSDHQMIPKDCVWTRARWLSTLNELRSLLRAGHGVGKMPHVDIERYREAQMPFGKGARGSGVVQLQQALNGWITSCHALGVDTGLIEVVADGTFGQNTAVALAAYQKSAGLPPSGYADQDTLLSLELDGTLEANGTMWAGGGGV